MPVLAEPFIVAHRGASGDAPENTLRAFRLAWKQGADAIEGDFHLTNDGRIVCFHDRNTRKLTGDNYTISQTTLAELQSLDAGSWKGREFAGTRIPTIEEVFHCIPPGKQIFIEIKCGVEIVPALLQAVKRSGLSNEQIVVISFSEAVVRTVRRQRPEWKVNWLYGFNSKTPGDPDNKIEALIATLKDLDVSGLGSSAHPGLREDHLKILRERGFQHHVWTVNNAAVARRFLRMGSRSITTDYPGKLRKALLRTGRQTLP